MSIESLLKENSNKVYIKVVNDTSAQILDTIQIQFGSEPRGQTVEALSLLKNNGAFKFGPKMSCHQYWIFSVELPYRVLRVAREISDDLRYEEYDVEVNVFDSAGELLKDNETFNYET